MDKLEEYGKLRSEVESCRKCSLWRTRLKPVVGEGPLDSNVMLVGLGPGYHENLEGRPFVGAAGKLLDKLLDLAELDRRRIYITNVVKCYLPDNRATEEQIEACTPYLDRQISMINPRLIVALGSVAVNYLLSKYGFPAEPISRIHGQIFSKRTLEGIVYIVAMYHPASALYKPPLRKALERDWINLGSLIEKLSLEKG